MTILKNDKKTGGNNSKTKGAVPGNNSNDAQGINQFGDTAPNLPPRSQQLYSTNYVGPPRPSTSSTSFRRPGLGLPATIPHTSARFGRDNLTNVLASEYKSVQGKRLNRTLSDDPSKRRKSSLTNESRETTNSVAVHPPSTNNDSMTLGSTAPSKVDEKGCNSEDEYDSRSQESMTEEEINDREVRFIAKLGKKGLIIKPMGEDGACLFRAVADQVYGDQETHEVIRKQCMDYIAKNQDYFSQYITEDFNDYVNRKRLNHVHGNHIEIQAISEMYNRTVEVYCYRSEPMNIFNREHHAAHVDDAPLRLSYHRGTHYNSVVDPNKPAIGVGLGLPGIHPGLADKQSLEEVTKRNEDGNIEQTMLDDKLRATDWEATDEAINEEVARESYLQWLRENERKGKRSPKAGTSSMSSNAMMSSPPRSMSPPKGKKVSRESSPMPIALPGATAYEAERERPRHLSGQQNQNPIQGSSQQHMKLSHTLELAESLTFVTQLPPDLFGVDEWDDSQGIMAQVLAASQQEYLDYLKSQQSQSQNSQESNPGDHDPDPVPVPPKSAAEEDKV